MECICYSRVFHSRQWCYYNVISWRTTVMNRGQREAKGVGVGGGDEELYQACQRRLHCEPAAASCDCPAVMADVPTYTAAAADVTSCRTCYSRWPPHVVDTEHARDDASSVLTLRCLED